jgi:hypothetical protein
VIFFGAIFSHLFGYSVVQLQTWESLLGGRHLFLLARARESVPPSAVTIIFQDTSAAVAAAMPRLISEFGRSRG